AVREVIAKMTQHHAGESVAKAKSNKEKEVPDDLYQQLLDLEMLQSYVEIVGSQPVIDSVHLFEQSMPAYLAVLDSNMVAKDQEGIVSEAHKIKGAAGSVGLKRIQKIAQKAQSPEAPAWWENISDWVEEIKNEYQSDIAVLKRWLIQQANAKQ
ncbi:Hpt domain-containing protein, partial [Vibrio cholerae]